MRVLELTNVEREESELFYRRKYKCNATLDLPTNKETIPVLFTIETEEKEIVFAKSDIAIVRLTLDF